MLLYPLIIGILALLSPFWGLVILMSYLARTIGISYAKPLQSIAMFFVVPVVALLLDTQVSTQVMALDAIIGVGLSALVYLLMLKRNHVLSEAFMVSFILMAAYGIVRFQVFGDYQSAMFDEGINMLNQQMPVLLESSMLTQTMPIWKLIMPSVWIVTQGFALLLGFLLFQRLLQVPVALKGLRFPGLYNLLIIAILPLYLFEQTKMLFVNALIALCFIPFIQGIAVMWQRLGLIFSNRIVVSILLVFITLYANILLVLLGFADMWLSKRNTIPGGTTA